MSSHTLFILLSSHFVPLLSSHTLLYFCHSFFHACVDTPLTLGSCLLSVYLTLNPYFSCHTDLVGFLGIHTSVLWSSWATDLSYVWFGDYRCQSCWGFSGYEHQSCGICGLHISFLEAGCGRGGGGEGGGEGCVFGYKCQSRGGWVGGVNYIDRSGLFSDATDFNLVCFELGEEGSVFGYKCQSRGGWVGGGLHRSIWSVLGSYRFQSCLFLWKGEGGYKYWFCGVLRTTHVQFGVRDVSLVGVSGLQASVFWGSGHTSINLVVFCGTWMSNFGGSWATNANFWGFWITYVKF